MKENHGFIYFYGTGYKHMTRELKSHHQVEMNTVQETAQEVCKAIFSHITSFNSLIYIQEKIWQSQQTDTGPSLQSNSHPESSQRKPEMSKTQIKANTLIESSLLIWDEISWLYSFQSTFQPHLPTIQKFAPIFKCSKRCWIIVPPTFSLKAM